MRKNLSRLEVLDPFVVTEYSWTFGMGNVNLGRSI